MTKMFWMIAIPISAFITILVAINISAQIGERHREWLQIEKKSIDFQSGYQDGKILIVTRKKGYGEIIK